MINSPAPGTVPSPSGDAPIFTTDSSNIHAAPLPPQPPSKGDSKRIILIGFILLFIAAVGGGLFAYQKLTTTQKEELTQVQPTLAWQPTVTGTCSGGQIVREKESVPFLINLDMKLNGTDSAPTQSFLSQGSDNSINKSFNWNFSTAVKKGDKITWNATVKYTLSGNLHEEKYSGTIDIIDDCTAASASPTASAAPSTSASPTATPAATRTPVPTASPTEAPTASPTASPTSTPAVGGPSATPTPTPTNTPAPTATNSPAPTSSNTVAQTTATPTPDQRAVADANATAALPSAGANNGITFAIIGAISIALSAVFALLKKRYY